MAKAVTGYFDASGHPDQSKSLTVAGFLSTTDKWDRFEREWSAILVRHELTAFHMTDYVSGEGQYSKFKKDSTLRRQLQSELMACIKKNTNKAVRTTLILLDYNEVNRRRKLRERLGPPYAVCARQCLAHTLSWARRKGRESNLLCYFEDGDKHKGEFQKACAGLLPANHQLQFLTKGSARAFEAADFVAWKARTNADTWISKNHRTAEKGQLIRSLGLLNNIPTIAEVITGEVLVGICNYLGVERR